MPILYTEIVIHASRRRVWQALSQKNNWLYWNTFLYDCSPRQPLHQGEAVQLSVRRVEGDDETEFAAFVTLMQPPVCLKWVVQIPGFRHEQVFELQDLGRDRTQYIHQSHFSGPLCQLFLPFIRRDEHRGMQRMARQLKGYTENWSSG
jgi:hypothetical protein